MATKNNPGPYDCYTHAHPDEPIFILRAHDELAPTVVETWASLYKAKKSERGEFNGKSILKYNEARQTAGLMRQWVPPDEGHPVEQPPPSKPIIDTTNDYGADLHQGNVIFNRPIKAMTRDQALRLAAYIVILTDDGREPCFDDILHAVQERV